MGKIVTIRGRVFSWAAVLVLLLEGCASPPRKAETERYTPGDCQGFCEVIRSCAADANHAELGDLLCETARCETGDKCKGKIRSPTGKFWGPFQFLPGTWTSLCTPFFARRRIQSCSGPNAMYDTCCSAMCAAELVATDTNGGIGNWPACGRRAERVLAARQIASEKTTGP